MAWCETNRVDFVFGLARNARLVEEIAVELLEAEAEAASTGKAARRYKDFRYATLDSWSRRRRVIGKAEWGSPSKRSSPCRSETSAAFSKLTECRHASNINVIHASGNDEGDIQQDAAEVLRSRISTSVISDLNQVEKPVTSLTLGDVEPRKFGVLLPAAEVCF